MAIIFFYITESSLLRKERYGKDFPCFILVEKEKRIYNGKPVATIDNNNIVFKFRIGGKKSQERR
jgi:hypothetical protein